MKIICRFTRIIVCSVSWGQGLLALFNDRIDARPFVL